jgi:Zn-dependent protease with chaperone function
MVMNFIEAQDNARARTGRLIVFFAISVFLTIGVLYLAVTASLVLSADPEHPLPWWQPIILLYVGIGTLGVIGFGSLYKTNQLSSGGSAVAESLGGALVHPDARGAAERRLLNVVEEMAIASGCPVPPVYLIEDQSINAFAAGFTHDTAVIGVTRGCVETLSRDELQGVMAHEFSHIVHGDMRLNIRLTGVIFGIMAIGFIGYLLFRFVAPSMLYSRDKNGSSVGMGVFGLGLLLMLVGAIGTFFARVIQAAVSRQREFLADASAVDYTRNPSGIAGALRKIGGLDQNAMKQATASEFQHFFFTPALHTVFATHPPLPERIARIEQRPIQQEDNSDPHAAAPGLHAAAAGFAAGVAQTGRNLEMRDATAVRTSLANIGDAGPAHLAYARAVLAHIPKEILDAVRDPIGAMAVCLLLLADNDPRVSGRQAKLLDDMLSKAVKVELMRLQSKVSGAINRSPELRLVLGDLVMPALGRLPKEDAGVLRQAIKAMIDADGRIDRFEWVLGRLLMAHLNPPKRRAAKRTLESLAEPARTMFAMLAWSGARSEEEALKSFRASAGAANLGDVELPGEEDCSIKQLDTALDALATLRFRDRAVMLEAAVDGVCADGKATLGEVEFLRALAATLSCPMPPVLPGPIPSDVHVKN